MKSIRCVIAGCYLKRFRLSLPVRLSFRDMAEECDLSVGGYFNLEHGYSWPTPKTVKTVLKALKNLVGRSVDETEVWPALQAHYEKIGGVK